MKTMNDANASVFAELQKINADCKIFLVAQGTELDAEYLALYGNRMTFDDFNSQGTANALNVMCASNWDNAYDLFLASGKLMIDMGNMTSTVTTKQYDYTDTVANVDSLPAFDNAELQTDKKTDRELTHKVNTDTETVQSDSKDISRFGTAWNYLQKNLIRDIVYRDLNKLATLSIHTY